MYILESQSPHAFINLACKLQLGYHDRMSRYKADEALLNLDGMAHGLKTVSSLNYIASLYDERTFMFMSSMPNFV